MRCEAETQPLSALERAALSVLHEGVGRVHSRRELARRLGVAHLHDRLCDSLVVSLRRRLGPDAIITVRSRGWMLHPSAADLAAQTLAED